MGRYVTSSSGNDYKFWFAIQDSGDILEFTNQDDGVIHSFASDDDLEWIDSKLKELKDNFFKVWKISYKDFMKKIDDKGYVRSINDKETNTQEWENMCVLASRILLGEWVKDEIKKEGCVDFRSEC